MVRIPLLAVAQLAPRGERGSAGISAPAQEQSCLKTK